MKKSSHKHILILLILSLSLMLSSCSEKPQEKESLDTKVNSKISAYTTDLHDSAETLSSNASVTEYLSNWAKSKNLNYDTDALGNVIVRIPASESNKNIDPIVLICSYDAQKFKESVSSIAMGLYIAKNIEGSGNINIIFSPSSSGSFDAAKNIASYIPEKAKVFCVSNGSRSSFGFNCGYSSKFTFSNEIKYKEPQGKTAIKVSISGLDGGTPDSRISSYPNPIKEFANILGTYKAKAKIFELASFNGGSNPYDYPKNAEMVIVVGADDEKYFTDSLTSFAESWSKNYEGTYPESKFVFEKTELPAAVFDGASLDNFINAAYTLLDGVYYKNADDSVISITNIGILQTTETAYMISASASSLDKEKIDDLNRDYGIISSLASIKFAVSDERTGWGSIENSEALKLEFAEKLSAAYYDYSGSKLSFKNCIQPTAASVLYELLPNTEMVNIVVSPERTAEYTGTVVTYIINSTEKKDS